MRDQSSMGADAAALALIGTATPLSLTGREVLVDTTVPPDVAGPGIEIVLEYPIYSDPPGLDLWDRPSKRQQRAEAEYKAAVARAQPQFDKPLTRQQRRRLERPWKKLSRSPSTDGDAQ